MISYKKLRMILAEKGISWKDFRLMCGLTPKTVKKIKENAYVDLETLVKVCCVLHLNIGDVADVIHESDIYL